MLELPYFQTTLWSMSIVMMVLFFYAQRKKNVNVVDAGWAGGMAIFALYLMFVVSDQSLRSLFIGGLVFVWAMRLFLFLVRHRVGKKPEDNRYRRMRKSMGSYANVGFFVFFQLQALLVPFCLIFPWIAMNNPSPFPQWMDFIGLGLFIISIIGETLADEQLNHFKSKPENKGKVCQAGLWRYSRHPNYFFEWVHWWAYVFFAFGSPVWGWTLLGPVSMYFFLVYLTGIPHAERESLANRGEAYRTYQKTTPRFFPRKPRSS